MNKFIATAISISAFTGGNLNGSYAQNPERPNLVFVLADQLRYDWLGYAGDFKAMTPNLDKLADQSVNFSNTVTVTPVCAAMRASLLTGKYTSSTGMVINELRMNPDHRAIGHVLTENGYETALIGKWHLYGNEAGSHNATEQSFTPPGPHRLGFDGLWKSYGFWHLYYQAYYFEDTPERIYYDEGVYETEAQFDYAIDFIIEASKTPDPFAVFLPVGIPHNPWSTNNVPEKYLALFEDVDFPLPVSFSDIPDQYMDRFSDPVRWLEYYKPNIPLWTKVYYAMVAALDDYMGKLMNTLEDLGVADNTILVFTSDHGEMMGEQGRIQKMIFYDAAARAPFLVRWPGKIPAGLNSDACINTPDIMPTLLGLMELPVPEEVEGMDVSHLALGIEGPSPEFAFMQGMGHTYLWKDGSEWRSIRNKRFTYATYLIDGKELLFDNQNDPQQLNNIVDNTEYKHILDKLRDDMHTKMEELNDEFMPCSWYEKQWTDGNRNIIRSAKGEFKPIETE